MLNSFIFQCNNKKKYSVVINNMYKLINVKSARWFSETALMENYVNDEALIVSL